MNKSTKNLINSALFICFILAFIATNAYSYKEVAVDYTSERLDLISSSLDAVERGRAKKVNYTRPTNRRSFQRQVVPSYDSYADSIEEQPKKNPFYDIQPERPSTESNIEFEFGQENSIIKYVEPDVMKEKGHMHGIFASATYRPYENQEQDSIQDMLSPKNRINVFSIDARTSWGRVNYESSQGKLDGLEDFMFETKGTIGCDLLFKNALLTPYVGLGYRYQTNDLRGEIPLEGGGVARGYRRKSQYLYIPLGMDASTKLNKDFEIGMNFEYDFLITGKQTSYTSDIDPGLTDLNNKQGKGHGVKTSVNLKKNCNSYNIFVEPFYRFWSIADSDINPIYYNGALNGYGYEPKNNSNEYGIKLGLNF